MYLSVEKVDCHVSECEMSRTYFLPVHRHSLLDRSQLIDYALSGNPALIILRGVRGMGKTIAATQLSKVFVTMDRQAEAVWVRFDAGHAGLQSVWQHVLSRLAEAKVLSDQTQASRLVDGGVPSTQAVIDVLIERKSPLIVVFDDAHQSITPDVEESILEVLENVPSLTIVITTRQTLSTLVSHQARLRIPIRKITKDRLQLTQQEILELVYLRLPTAPYPEAMAAQIHKQSGGWPLAVHSLLVEQENLPHGKTIPVDYRPKSSLFVTELVDRALNQADELGKKALCTVALFGEVSASILSFILEVSCVHLKRLLTEQLVDIFDHWNDEQGTRWYHLHDLVAEEIQDRAASILTSNELKCLARRATEALRDQRPRLAMRAAVQGEAWDLLSELLLQGTAITLSRQQHEISLDDLPAEVRTKYPILGAFALIHEYAYPTGLFGKAKSVFKALTSKQLRIESQKPGFPGLTAAVLRMIINRLIGNEKTALEMAELAHGKLQYLAETEISDYTAALQVAMTQIAITYIHAGRLSEVLTLLEPMYVRLEELQPKSRAHTVALIAWSTAWAGAMNAAEMWIQRCEHTVLPVDWRNSYIGTGYRIAAALRALDAGDTARAREHMDALVEHEVTIEHWPYLAYIQALITEIEHGPAAALSQLAARRKWNIRRSSTMFPAMRTMLSTLQARLEWHTGKVLPAVRKQHATGLPATYAALSRGDYAIAAATLAMLATSPEISSLPRAHSEVLLLRAETARLMKDTTLAFESATQAAVLMEEHCLTLPMRVLSKNSAHALQRLVPQLQVEFAANIDIRTIQPLTPAEQRALIAVVEHGTINAAAAALYLSPETVKGHIKLVYRKLQVNSRADAIKAASEAGLLNSTEGRDG